MRGLTVTRREGEHVVLTRTSGDDVIVLGVITLAKIDGSRVRLRIMADAEIGIRRYQGALSDDGDDQS